MEQEQNERTNERSERTNEKNVKPRINRRNVKEAEAFMDVLLAFGAGVAGAVSAAASEKRMVQLLGCPHATEQCVAGFNCPIHGEYNRRTAQAMREALEGKTE